VDRCDLGGDRQLDCQLAEAGPSRITFQSVTYADFRQLLQRQPPTATVAVPAILETPDETRDRYPVVVIVHTLGGYSERNEGWYAAELHKAGFATLTYDSFAGRGTTGLALFRSGPGISATGVADAYAALRLIRGSTPIALPSSVFPMAAKSRTWRPSRNCVPHWVRGQPGLPRMSRIIRPVCLGRSPPPAAYTGSPVMMLLGGKDDNLPVAKVS
jgi:hypothetical protein